MFERRPRPNSVRSQAPAVDELLPAEDSDSDNQSDGFYDSDCSWSESQETGLLKKRKCLMACSSPSQRRRFANGEAVHNKSDLKEMLEKLSVFNRVHSNDSAYDR